MLALVQSQSQIAVGVVILAAGSSRRMGQPKLLLSWGNTSVLGHAVQQWQKLGVRQIAAVCARGRPEVLELEKLSRHSPPGTPPPACILNPAPERGMFSSVQSAANWTGWMPELTHWLVTLGDQPQLRLETLRALLDFAASHSEKICQPLRRGRRKHPVLLPKFIFAALASSAARDLKQFLESHSNACAGFESSDAGLDFDLDTPEDYERLKNSAGP